MIEHGIEFHNVVELETVPGIAGLRLRRSPASACRAMSPRGRWNSQMSSGTELRFVTEAREIRLFLSTLEGDAPAEVFQGDLFHSSHMLAPGGPVCLHLAPAQTLEDLPDASRRGRFPSTVWRVLLPGLFPVFHHLETFGWPVRPPTDDEKPRVRWLAYGSSITAGTGASTPHLNYVQQTAARLGMDALNLGQGGACMCEPDLADFLAARGDWDVATLEIGVNMLETFSVAEFEQRAGYLVSAMTKANPGKPVVLITPFLNSHHLRGAEKGEKQQAFTQVLEGLAARHGCPCLDGRRLLTDFTGLCADGIHPFDMGMAEIARNLAKEMKAIMEEATPNSVKASIKAPFQAVERFRGNRLGLFIHYGLYSLLARREWAMYYERIPVEEYRQLAGTFRPGLDVAEAWAQMAKRSGMKYMCLTARHHDGFCLFRTSTTGFNSVKTAAARNLVGEFVAACRRHGLRPALYYSVADWSDPGYTAGPNASPDAWRRFVETVHTQLRELMTQYGPIDYLFYDGCPPPELWDATGINRSLRTLQPELLISDRCRLDEDVASSENHVGAHDKPWECCMTTNDSWGCNTGDIHRKSAFDLVKTLATCMHTGGNFLLNVGPLPDGSVHPEDTRLFEALGDWVARNQEAVFGSTPAPFNYCDYKLSCAKGSTAYIALHFYHGPNSVVAGIGNTVKSIRLVGTGESIAFHQERDRVFMTGLPEAWPDVLPVVALELDGSPRGVPNPYESGAKFVF